MSALFPPDLLWLGEGLLAALVVGLLLAAVTGALLVARPHTLFAFNTRASRWIDTTRAFNQLEKPRYWERFFYRHHRALGALIALGAGYVLWQRTFAFDRAAVVEAVNPRLVHSGLDFVVAAGDVLGVLLQLIALTTGLIVLFRPSLLRSIERAANRWHRGPSTHGLDAVMGQVDAGFAIYPRVCGLVLLAASLWCLSGLLPVLERALAG